MLALLQGRQQVGTCRFIASHQFDHNGNLRIVQHLHGITGELGCWQLHSAFAVGMSCGHTFELQTRPQTLGNEARLLLQDLHDTSTNVAQTNKSYLNGLHALPVPRRVMRLEQPAQAAQGLTRAVRVLNQGKAHVLISTFAKPNAW